MSVHMCPYFFFSMDLPSTVQRDILGLFKLLLFLRMALYQNIVSERDSVMSDSLSPRGLSMEFSRPEYRSG